MSSTASAPVPSKPASSPTSTAPPPLGRRALIALMGGLMLGLLLSALDTMIMASAMRVIADELHGSTLQAWATTAYLLTSVVTTPLYGKLSDLYGRKPLYLVAIGLFMLGSVLCGLAGSIEQLAAARAVQGLGAGGLMTLAFTILADVLEPEERARRQAWFSSVFAVATVAGPVLGGFFAGLDSFLGAAGWRWAFLINVPVGLVALTVVALTFRLQHERRAHRLDLGGALTLVLGLVPLLLVVEQGGEWGWTSARTLVLAAVGLAAVAGFVAIQRRMGDDAILPPRLFASRVFTLVNGVNVLIGLAAFAGLGVLPLYLQLVQGLSPTQAGLMLVPQTAAIIVTGWIAGPVIARTRRYRPFVVAGVASIVVAELLFARLGVGSSLWHVVVATLFMGVGFGLSFNAMLLAVQSGAPAGALGAATASFTFFQRIGGTLGAAVFVSLLFSLAGDRLAGFDLDDTSFVDRLDPQQAQPVLAAFADASGVVYGVLAAVLAVALVLALLVPRGAASDGADDGMAG